MISAGNSAIGPGEPVEFASVSVERLSYSLARGSLPLVLASPFSESLLLLAPVRLHSAFGTSVASATADLARMDGVVTLGARSSRTCSNGVHVAAASRIEKLTDFVAAGLIAGNSTLDASLLASTWTRNNGCWDQLCLLWCLQDRLLSSTGMHGWRSKLHGLILPGACYWSVAI